MFCATVQTLTADVKSIASSTSSRSDTDTARAAAIQILTNYGVSFTRYRLRQSVEVSSTDTGERAPASYYLTRHRIDTEWR